MHVWRNIEIPSRITFAVENGKHYLFVCVCACACVGARAHGRELARARV